MAEEFLQGGICGGTWWNLPSSKSACAGCSSPCMPGITDFGWASGLARDDCSSNCSSFSSFQSHHQKLQRPDSDSSLQIVGFGLSSSSTSDWNQSLPSRSNSMLQEEISSSTGELDSSVTVFKPINQDFPFDQPPVTASSASYNYPPTTTAAAALIQTLFDDDPRPPPQPSVFNGRPVNYAADQSYGAPATSNDQLSSSWPKLPPFFRPASLLKQQQSAGSLQFTNNSPFWNAASNDGGTRSFSASSQSQFLQTVFAEKPSCPNQLNIKRNGEEVREGKKGSSETPTVKKARIETPSPLPTFKVRKEKLGDRITALQQLVSPFGKTDTASVLHEAIEYIKFLHDQVTVLSTPYMKQGGSPIQHQQMKGVIPADNNIAGKDPEAAAGANQDLRSRGLCLVPISNTFPLATETTADFWTPTFGATFR